MQQLEGQFVRWRREPSLFFEEALGVRLTNQQLGACEVVRDMIRAKRKRSEGKPLGLEGRRYFGATGDYSEQDLADAMGISIHSGKGLGKDFWIAGLSPFFLLLYPGFKGLATGPSKQQVEDVYSNEVKRLLNSSPLELWRHVEVIRDSIRQKVQPEVLITKRTATVKGNVEEQAETLQGIHAPYMVMLIDEASGLPDGCFKPLEETLTGYCNFCISITNVTRNTGFAYRTHYDEKERPHWICLRWNAEESDLDDVTGHQGLSASIERMRSKYGVDSNPYRIAVQGLPPKAEADALLDMAWVYAARDRWDEIDVDPENDPVVLGVDVGRGGDDSAIARRVGIKVMDVKTKSTSDTSVLADWLDSEMESHQPDLVCVDAGGMGGPFCDTFRKFYKRDICELNVSEGASRNDRYFRLRDELWIGEVREAFARGRIAIPNDQELIFELLSLKVENSWEQPQKVVSKRKLKALGLKSPNRADALMHTFYFRGATTERQRSLLEKYGRGKRDKQPSEHSWMTA